jgi:hypothetical protein
VRRCEECDGVRGSEPDRLAVVRDRTIGLGLVFVGVATSNKHIGVARIDLDRPIKVGDRAIVVALGEIGLSAAMQRGRASLVVLASRIDDAGAGRNFRSLIGDTVASAYVRARRPRWTNAPRE